MLKKLQQNQFEIAQWEYFGVALGKQLSGWQLRYEGESFSTFSNAEKQQEIIENLQELGKSKCYS